MSPNRTVKEVRKTRIKGALLVAAGLVVVFFTAGNIAQVLMFPIRYAEPAKNADVIIVLGGGLKKDGSIGPIVANRIRAGIALKHAGYANIIELSGGPVKSKKFTESIQMAAFAQRFGYNGTFVEEKQSTSTRGNAEFSKMLMAERGWTTALLVTSPYHERRACETFRALKMNVTCTPADPALGPALNIWERVLLLKGVIREYGATIYYWMKGYLHTSS